MESWIKICGMTTPEAVQAALDAGADAIGFVFAPSVRQVTPAQARELARPARGRVDCVAVTLHPEQALVDAILREFEPDLLQTDLEDFATLKLPRTQAVLPVLRPDSAVCGSYPARVLVEGARSGTGQTSDWTQAMELARATRVVLAGGLHAGNVAAAIAAVRPFGVDTSSGVEVQPGAKSPAKIFEFVSAARAAFGAGT